MLIQMKRTLLLVPAVLIALSSCQKDNDSITSPYAPNKFEDLKVPSSFDWKLERKVTLNIEGLQGLPSNLEIKKTMKIKGQDGKVLMQFLHNISESKSLELLIPTRYTSLEVEAGNTVRTVSIASNGTASFSFVVNTDNIN